MSVSDALLAVLHRHMRGHKANKPAVLDVAGMQIVIFVSIKLVYQVCIMQSCTAGCMLSEADTETVCIVIDAFKQSIDGYVNSVNTEVDRFS